jgi:hypothetical protein
MAAAWLIRVADDGSSASTTPTYPQLDIPQLTVAIDMSNTLGATSAQKVAVPRTIDHVPGWPSA